MPSDWAAEAAGRIEAVVAAVRAKTVDRAVVLARLLVFGFVGAVMGLTGLILVVILAVRALDTVLPRSVWLADMVLGCLFVVAGLVLWSKGGGTPAPGLAHPASSGNDESSTVTEAS